MSKVHGGTPRSEWNSICLSCRSAHVVRGQNNQEIVFCQVGRGFRVHFPVHECSLYDNKSQPALYQMHDIAWEVKSRNHGPIGFADSETIDVVIEPPADRNGGGQGPVSR